MASSLKNSRRAFYQFIVTAIFSFSIVSCGQSNDVGSSPDPTPKTTLYGAVNVYADEIAIEFEAYANPGGSDTYTLKQFKVSAPGFSTLLTSQAVSPEAPLTATSS
ncbi:hypothetical protein [Spirosoma areae]